MFSFLHCTSLELVCPVSSSLSAKMLGILVMPVLLGLLTDSPQTKRRGVSQDYAEKVTMGGGGFDGGIGGVICVVIKVLEIGCVSACVFIFLTSFWREIRRDAFVKVRDQYLFC